MLNKKNTSPQGENRQRTVSRVRSLYQKILMPALIILGFFAIVYSTVVIGKLTASVSYEETLPKHIVRLEVLNASTNKAVMRDFCRLVDGFADEFLEIHVVDTARYKRTDITTSMVISRESDLTAAQLMTDMIGVARSELSFKPYDYNQELVTVTIVIGDDFDLQIADKNISEKET